VRVKGSHHRYEKAGRDPITIPVHGNQSLPTGTQHAVRKAAGLTEADL
jgi:predicted RNA binding protein YcfA (HicA-like mRNA interferase family)